MVDLADKLKNVLDEHAKKDEKNRASADSDAEVVADFFNGPVADAFSELRQAFEANGRTVQASISPGGAYFSATHEGTTEVRVELAVNGRTITPISEHVDRTDGRRFRSQGYFRSGAQDYTAADITKDEIVNHIVREWQSHFR